MSDHVEEKLLKMLAGPLESPYGNPIPGLEELGGPQARPGAFREGVLSLPDAVAAGQSAPEHGNDLMIRRLGERLQIDVELMKQLQGAGMVPGSRVQAQRTPTGYLVNLVQLPETRAAESEGGVALLADVARHVFVEAM